MDTNKEMAWGDAYEKISRRIWKVHKEKGDEALLDLFWQKESNCWCFQALADELNKKSTCPVFNHFFSKSIDDAKNKIGNAENEEIFLSPFLLIGLYNDTFYRRQNPDIITNWRSVVSFLSEKNSSELSESVPQNYAYLFHKRCIWFQNSVLSSKDIVQRSWDLFEKLSAPEEHEAVELDIDKSIPGKLEQQYDIFFQNLGKDILGIDTFTGVMYDIAPKKWPPADGPMRYDLNLSTPQKNFNSYKDFYKSFIEKFGNKVFIPDIYHKAKEKSERLLFRLFETFKKHTDEYEDWLTGYKKFYQDLHGVKELTNELHRRLIFDFDNKISSVGQSLLSNESYQKLCNDAKWNENLNAFFQKPNDEHYLSFKECWIERNSSLGIQPFPELRLNRIAAAFTTRVSTVCDKVKFNFLVGKLKEDGIVDASCATSGNWFKDNCELMESFDEILGKRTKDDPFTRNVFAWFLWEHYHNGKGTEMFNSLVEINSKFVDLLTSSKQLILTGAPGTGKTYKAEQIAATLILGEEDAHNRLKASRKTIEESEKKGGVDENVLKSAKELVDKFNSHYEFVQFHPGYDYSDFVEGLKPEVDDIAKQVVFERKDGVFMEFCKRAEHQSFSGNVFEQAYQKLRDTLRESSTGVLEVKPSSKDFRFQIQLNRRDNLSLRYGTDFAQKAVITKNNLFLRYSNGQLSYTSLNCYIDGVLDLMKSDFGLPKEYKPEQNSHSADNVPYVFVIDEINRADLSRVFGELFYGLEEDYRGKPIKTQYSYLREEGEPDFTIPKNVYIIGTMNDIDRSVESMDFALRRRFAWHEITAEDSMGIIDAISLKDEDKKEISLANIKKIAQAKMEAVNKYIGPWSGKDEAEILEGCQPLSLGKEYQLGGAYFKKIEKYIRVDDDTNTVTADWDALWSNHIEVILREYLRGRKDAEKILKALHGEYNKAESTASEPDSEQPDADQHA